MQSYNEKGTEVKPLKDQLKAVQIQQNRGNEDLQKQLMPENEGLKKQLAEQGPHERARKACCRPQDVRRAGNSAADIPAADSPLWRCDAGRIRCPQEHFAHLYTKAVARREIGRPEL